VIKNTIENENISKNFTTNNNNVFSNNNNYNAMEPETEELEVTNKKKSSFEMVDEFYEQNSQENEKTNSITPNDFSFNKISGNTKTNLNTDLTEKEKLKEEITRLSKKQTPNSASVIFKTTTEPQKPQICNTCPFKIVNSNTNNNHNKNNNINQKIRSYAHQTTNLYLLFLILQPKKDCCRLLSCR